MDRYRGHGAERDEMGKMSGCAAFGPLLEAHYHHALEPRTAQTVAEHVAGCAACGAALERFAAIDQLIADAPMPAPGPELHRRLAARIATARAHRSERSPGLVSPMPIERTAVVQVVNDRDTNNQQGTRPGKSARAGKGMQRMRVLLGTVAAALVVALLAGALLTRPHGPASGNVVSTPTPGNSNQSNTPTPDDTAYATSNQFTKPAGTCDPASIKAQMPAHALLFDLAMVSPNEGWAVGAIEDAGNGDPVGSLILHYTNCAWKPVVADNSGATLMGVSMTSATDGWAVGGSSDGKQIALHYTGGQWRPVTLPRENTFNGSYDLVRMHSSGDGWIVATHQKNSQGIAIDSLLHMANGHWSVVDNPVTAVRDVLPVSQNEAWMAGVIIGSQQQTPALYHYQAGKWTSVSLPTGVNIDRLRMVSPNNLWASGHINAPSNWDTDQTAAVLHYDGNQLRQANIGANGNPQFVQAFDGDTSWAFAISNVSATDIIGSVRYQRGGSWLAVKWPFTNMGMGLVAFGMTTMQRVSADEYCSSA